MSTTAFESIPNEILLSIFEYLPGVRLLRAFSPLNRRFEQLIYNEHHSHTFDFHSMSKQTFHMLCHDHLPSITHRILSLALHGTDQINLFFSYIPSLNGFSRLCSLIFHSIDSDEVLRRMVDECRHLSNLLDLQFHSCRYRSDLQSILDTIWSTLSLRRCSLDIVIDGHESFPMPGTSSASMECVSLLSASMTIKSSQLTQLFERTPCLRRLTISTKLIIDTDEKLIRYPTLKVLKVRLVEMNNAVRLSCFLRHFPALRSLDIDMESLLLNGYKWKYLLRKHLCLLREFRLKMLKRFVDHRNREDQLRDLIDSFRQSFWIDQHRWFVRAFANTSSICLYTPDLYEYEEETLPTSFASTNPSDEQSMHWTNIEHIFLKFYPMNTDLSRLKSLIISPHIDLSEEQFQTLFDRTPHLRHLEVHQEASTPLQMSILDCRCPSLRSLSFRCDRNIKYRYFNQRECLALTRSILLRCCELVSIGVTNRKSILDLLDGTGHVFLWNIQCGDDRRPPSLTTMVDNEEIIRWLKHRLPSAYSIIADAHDTDMIRIWV